MEGTPPLTSTRRLPELDGIRALAILLVLYWHFGSNQFTPQLGRYTFYFYRAGSLCWSGVDLFFVLSGFLLGGILLDNRHAPNLFKVFYIRRFCRIFPLYYLWMGIFALVIAFHYLAATPPAVSELPQHAATKTAAQAEIEK